MGSAPGHAARPIGVLQDARSRLNHQRVESMIRKSAYAILFAMGCVTAMAATASAATVGGEVFGAFSTHSMKDWNDRVVAPANQSGGNMDNFNNGYGGGLGMRVWPNSTWM